MIETIISKCSIRPITKLTCILNTMSICGQMQFITKKEKTPFNATQKKTLSEFISRPIFRTWNCFEWNGGCGWVSVCLNRLPFFSHLITNQLTLLFVTVTPMCLFIVRTCPLCYPFRLFWLTFFSRLRQQQEVKKKQPKKTKKTAHLEVKHPRTE